MRAVSSAALAPAIESDRTGIRPTEHLFGSIFGDIARLLWPHKTAAHVAAAVGCSERGAEMWLAGDREWSGDAVAVLVAEVLKRHHVRGVKVAARK